MVKKSKDLPQFDERFVNYGFNKITWLHHLIRRGYYFGVISRCFVMDMPHPEYVFLHLSSFIIMIMIYSSGFRVNYHQNLHNGEEKTMRNVYNKVQLRFNERYKNTRRFPVCFCRQKSYYEQI